VVDWSTCKRIAAWTPLSKIALPAANVSPSIFQIEDEAFFIAQDYNAVIVEDGAGPYVTLLAWAPTLGALRRVLNLEAEADELVERMPPTEMLLPGSNAEYGSLRRVARAGPRTSWLEHAAYRIAGDGQFSHRTLEVDSFAFHFRNRGGTKDTPFCIYYRLPRTGT